MFYELTPAYKDYKTAKDVKDAFNAGKDFSGDYQLGFKTVNKMDIPVGSNVILRYKGNTMTAVTKVKDHTLVPVPPKAADKKPPSIATMQKWMMDGTAKATDGCEVEPDGTCKHGCPSWLLKMGII